MPKRKKRPLATSIRAVEDLARWNGLERVLQEDLLAVVRHARMTDRVFAVLGKVQSVFETADLSLDDEADLSRAPKRRTRKKSAKGAELDENILAVLREKGELKAAELRAAVGYVEDAKRATFYKHATGLCEAGLIKRKGKSRASSYVITAKGRK